MIANIHAYGRILIIGHPASGKTTLCQSLAQVDPSKRPVWHTDDFMAHGWEGSLYALIASVDLSSPYIIEGVQGYRLLRKMCELGLDLPDVIVICKASETATKKRYADRGKAVPKGTDKALDSVWFDFLRVCKNVPAVVHYDTSIQH